MGSKHLQKYPDWGKKLIRWERGLAIGTEASFSSLLLILSGPVAFVMSKPLRTLYTSMADITFWSMRWLHMGTDQGLEHFYHQVWLVKWKSY